VTPNAAGVSHRIEELGPTLVELSHVVHTLAETGFEEHRSVSAVASVLEQHGIQSEVGAHGLSTAIRAEVGGPGPRVALLAEYDALLGVGHGCGHNIICASAVGAFLGLAAIATDLRGSVVLLGTPAEENGGGKEVLARAGAFEGIDAAVMLHPYAGPDLAHFVALGCRAVEVTYRGAAAHASANPEEGRNALDAVVAAYQGVASLRQHIPRTDRIHGIITDGGDAVNVVPERASAVFLLRSADPQSLRDLTARVHAILQGAALLTGTRLEARWDRVPPYMPVRSNFALAERYAEHMRARGRMVHDADGLPSGGGGSTDLGNISLRVPSIHPLLKVAPEMPLHSADFAAAAISTEADQSLVDGAVGLALTALDYLTDDVLREQVAADFAAAGGSVDVASLLRPPHSSQE
jgi:amidohydrolase